MIARPARLIDALCQPRRSSPRGPFASRGALRGPGPLHPHKPTRAHARLAPSPSAAGRIALRRSPRSPQSVRLQGPAPFFRVLRGALAGPRAGAFPQPGLWNPETRAGPWRAKSADFSRGSEKLGRLGAFGAVRCAPIGILTLFQWLKEGHAPVFRGRGVAAETRRKPSESPRERAKLTAPAK